MQIIKGFEILKPPKPLKNQTIKRANKNKAAKYQSK